MNKNSLKRQFYKKGRAFPAEKDMLCLSRGLLAAFYITFLISYVIYNYYGSSRIVYLLASVVQIVYAPGMFFAAGLMAEEFQKRRKNPSLAYSKTGVLFLGLYALIGLVMDVGLKDYALFTAIKNIIGLIRIPGSSAIFLSLGILYLLYALLWKSVVNMPSRPAVIIAVCLLGYLCVFIPEGILGYGALGVFIGGDRFGCIPIMTHLFAFAWGCTASYRNTVSVLEKLNACILFSLLVMGGLLAILHKKNAAQIPLGMTAAAAAIHISVWLLPFYRRAEQTCLHFLNRFWSSVSVYLSGENVLDMEAGRERRRYILAYLISFTGLFVLIAYMIFSPYLEADRSLIWSVDGLGQYIPKIIRFVHYVPSIFTDLIRGNTDFTQYDFRIGLGAPVSISFEPLYWLNLFLPVSSVESGYSALVMLRYFLAGLSMSCLLLYFKKSFRVSRAASLAYAFSGYAIFAGTRHSQFITPLILLPLLIVAMERLIREKKWYLFTILTAVSLLCSYYFLYMNTLALGIYFLARILCDKGLRTLKVFFSRFLVIAGSYLLGVSIGILSLFTSFGSYIGSGRSSSGTLPKFLSTTPLFYRAEWIPDFFVTLISDSFAPGMWLKLGVAPLAVFALVLLFTRNRRRELRAMFILYTLFCMFPIFGYIFSGFGSVTNRWVYIYVLLIIYVLADNLEHFEGLSRKELSLMSGLTAFYVLLISFSSKFHTEEAMMALAFLLLTYTVILLKNFGFFKTWKCQGKRILSIIVLLSIVINANLYITSAGKDQTHLETYVENGAALSKMTGTALRRLKDVPGYHDSDFFRSVNLEGKGSTRSSSLILNYHDIATFTSTLNRGIVNYNRAMGSCHWDMVSVYDYNARTYMNELASVRYVGASSKDTICMPYGYEEAYRFTGKSQDYTIYENKYTLPLGYSYDCLIPESQAKKESAAQRQEITMLAAIVNDDQLQSDKNLKGMTKSSSDLPLTCERFEISQIEAGPGVTIEDGLITIEEPMAQITLHFPGTAHAESYVSLKGDIYAEPNAKEHFIKTDIEAEGMSYQYKFRVDSYSTGQDEFLFNLGYHENAINSCTLTFEAPGQIRYSDLAVYVQTMDDYTKKALALKEDSLENVSVDHNTVTGTFRSDQDKFLLVSLPYQQGWKAFIDGKEAKICQANYQYMGIYVPAGNHEILLHYQLPGLHAAFLISGAGLLVFAAVILFNHFRKKRHRTEKNIT